MPQFLNTGFHGWSLLPISNHLAHHHITPKKITSITGLLTPTTSKGLPAHRTNASFFIYSPASPAMRFPVFSFLQILFAFLKLSFKTHLLLQVSSDWQQCGRGRSGGVGRRSLVFWCLTGKTEGKTLTHGESTSSSAKALGQMVSTLPSSHNGSRMLWFLQIWTHPDIYSDHYYLLHM